jgi:hypothetical protein
MNPGLQTRVLGGRNELLKFKDGIATLFGRCFSFGLKLDLWEWAYLDNPNGPPIVAVAVNSCGLVVGHYAVIPVSFLDSEQGCSRVFYLSMTTMVDREYQAQGLFQVLAQMVYKEAAYRHTTIIYGFPNKNSLNGFKKRLSWHVDGSVICSTSAAEAQSVLSSRSSRYYCALQGDQLTWRMNKPGGLYKLVSGCLFKYSAFGLDFIGSARKFSVLDALPPGQIINLLLHEDEADRFGILQRNPYPFGTRSLGLGLENNREIGLCMAMSDVF